MTMTTTVEHAQNLVADAERRASAHWKAGDRKAFHAACRERDSLERELHKAKQHALMVPGTGGSTTYWTDRSPVTVSRCTAKSVWVREDRWKLREGSAHDGSAEYLYVPQPDAPEKGPYRWSDKRGCFVHRGNRLTLGARARYYDPHL
jgi:hypothetical protein